MNRFDFIYDEISDEQRRRIIRMCAMTIMQNMDKTDSKLRENKENIKEFIFKSETAKKVGMKKAMQEMQFADFVGNHMIENKELYIELRTNKREKRLLEEMEKMGVIQHLEVEQPKGSTVQAGQTTPETRQHVQATPKTGHADNIIPIGEVKALAGQEAQLGQPNEGTKSGTTQRQKEHLTKTGDTNPKMAVSFAKLNKPDLLLTNKNTGKKEIKYGRYSTDRRRNYKFNYQGRKVQLTRVGRMFYKTSFMIGTDIDEYLVQTRDVQAEVFTYGLDIMKIEGDEQYRKIFFEQLISPENINMVNNNGYIGSIVQTKDPKNKYKIEYSDEEYTAVTELKDRLYKIKKDRRAGDKDDR